MMHPFLIRPMEFWKQITPELVGADIEDWYWISTEGRIYSSKSNKILKLSLDRDGYYCIGLYFKGVRKQKNFRVNRLVMLVFYPNERASELVANHINGYKSENDEFNLEWATYQQNTIHAFNHGLMMPMTGENNGMATITNAQAEYIAQLLSSELYTYDQINEMTGISKDIIGAIRLGSAWVEYYNKYELWNKYPPHSNQLFSRNEIHKICQYLQDNKISILNRAIKENILVYIGRESNYNTRKGITYIFSRRLHTDISSNYNF